MTTQSILVEDYASLESLVKQCRLLLPSAINATGASGDMTLAIKLTELMTRIDKHLQD